MSIYSLDDDPEKILVEGYKPTSGKGRIKKSFFARNIGMFEKKKK